MEVDEEIQFAPKSTFKQDVLTDGKTLGTWYFDKKSKKRKYIALTGRILSGFEAMHQCKLDKKYLENVSASIRAELQYNYFLSSGCQDLSDLSVWGIPGSVMSKYRKHKVTSLFRWQIDCLAVDNGECYLSGRNLIYSAPTSGGKTLVSELLMLRQLAKGSTGTIFFVVPFIALAEEKMRYFQDVWSDMNIGIKGFHVDEGASNELSEDIEVAVCTIERANILITQLLKDKKENQIKMIVIDEIHLLSDSHRGFLLEVMLSKVKYILPSVQIIGMSATLPNIKDLANWLNASLYTTEYRPVSLHVSVCMNRNLYSITTNNNSSKNDLNSNNNNIIISNESEDFILRRSLQHISNDIDGLQALCNETININKSVMLFCNSKRRCEVCATNIAQALSQQQYPQANNNNNSTINNINVFTGTNNALITNNQLFTTNPYAIDNNNNAIHNNIIANNNNTTIDDKIRNGRRNILEQLQHTQVGLCPTLKQTIPYGIAYHNAGLTLDERKIIEEGYRDGYILILCTTSTLSAGVNLPAHRVIIRTPRMGDQLINVATFRQMCGRAGRLGLDTNGEAILMISSTTKQEKEHAYHLMTSDLDPLKSKLHIGHGGGLEKLLLEMICCERILSEHQVMEFIQCTLMYVQLDVEKSKEYAKNAMLFLLREQFIHINNGMPVSTPLGVATTLSGISPKDAVLIMKPLLQARSKIILKGGLHPVFLVTPPSTSIEPDWNNYEKILDTLYQEHGEAKAVAEYLGVSQSQLCAFSFKNPSYQNQSDSIAFYRRFYSALILFIVIQEWPLTRVTKLLKNVTRGQIQQLQKDAAIFCGMTVLFCKKLNWFTLASCLDEYNHRLNYGANKDIVPLMRVSLEVTNIRARIFYKNGIETPQDIVMSGLEVITNLLIDSMPYSGTDSMDITKYDINNKSSKDNNNNNHSREMLRLSCERLARKIIMSAQEKIKEELENMQTAG